MASAKYHNDVARNSIAMASAQAVNAVLGFSLNRALSSADIAIGTTKSKVTSGAAVDYTANGVFASKAGTADLWTLAGPVIPPNSSRVFVLFLDVNGTASTAGVIATPGVSPWTVALQGFTEGKAIIGYVTVATNATTTFTPGTTLLDAAGVTTTFSNGVPDSIMPYICGPDGNVYGEKY